MFDHVTLRTSDLDEARRVFSPLMAGLGADGVGGPDIDDWEDIEWQDFGYHGAESAAVVTRGVHIGLVARTPELAEQFWRGGRSAGLASAGDPGPRAAYGEDYYGAFLYDRDGNSVEACLHERSSLPGWVDHVWLRVADVRASRDFYVSVAPFTGFALVVDEPALVRFRGSSASFTLLSDGAPVSSGLHMAFPGDDAAVEGFHAAAVAAGYRDNGGPGVRTAYSENYYAAFVLDPDGHNIEVVHHR